MILFGGRVFTEVIKQEVTRVALPQHDRAPRRRGMWTDTHTEVPQGKVAIDLGLWAPEL